MKKFRLIFILPAFLLSANVSQAAGPYEMGSIGVSGSEYKCRWTSPVRKSCYKADMQKIIKDFNSCYTKHMQQIQCKDVECIKREVEDGASDCCSKTGGKWSR